MEVDCFKITTIEIILKDQLPQFLSCMWKLKIVHDVFNPNFP